MVTPEGMLLCLPAQMATLPGSGIMVWRVAPMPLYWSALSMIVLWYGEVALELLSATLPPLSVYVPLMSA